MNILRVARKAAKGLVTNTSTFLGRQQGMAQLGLYFDGMRDTYASAGYDKSIDFKRYLARYLRQGIAKRVVNIVADESWRLDPDVVEGDNLDTARDDTEFVKSWRFLANGGQTSEGETQLGLLHYMHRLDRVAGIGHYAVMLLGLDDGKKLEEPAEAESLKRLGVNGLLYVSVFDEGSATILEYESNIASPRFGRPTIYNLTIQNGNTSASHRVHWSRIIHVADGAITDDYTGTPRLEAAWNQLIDLEKVMAAVGEAAYRLMIPTIIFSTRDGYELPRVDSRMSPDKQQEIEEAIAARSDQMDDIVHGLRHTMEVDGMEPTILQGTLQDPTASVQAIIDLISAATGIPQRLLLGSERGELASSQDEENWAKVVEYRQGKFITPAIIRPVVSRLIWLGILPLPRNGAFVVRHQPLLQTKQTEVAVVASTMADALQKIGAKVKVKEFVRVFIPVLPITAVEDAPEPVVPTPGQFGEDKQDGEDEPIAVNAAFFTDVIHGEYAYP